MGKISGNSAITKLQAIIIAIIIIVASIGATVYYLTLPSSNTPTVKTLKVAMLYATPLSEPFCAIHHAAFLKAQAELNITYAYSDNLGYGGDMERLTQNYADQGYNIIFTDVTVFEERARVIAKQYYESQNTIFMGSYSALPYAEGLGVYDWASWDACYLLGMLAGGMTKTNVIGLVESYPIPSVNKAVWAFKEGAKAVNPNVTAKMTYIENWYDPPKAKEAALAMVDAGADVLYEGRYGVIDAAVERNVYAIGGGGVDHYDLGPSVVLSSWTIDMYPLIKHTIELYRAGLWEPADFTDYSSLAKGGSDIAPYHNFTSVIPQSLQDLIAQKKQDIISGLFLVPIHTETLTSD